MTALLAALVFALAIVTAALAGRLHHVKSELQVANAALDQALVSVRETEHFLAAVDAQFFKDNS